MESFSEKLREARQASGHRSATSFYNWLKIQGISFNYSYYKKLENGGLPSEKVVNELALVLQGDWADKLILAYCQSLFPSKAHLFTLAPARPLESKIEDPGTKAASVVGSTGQKELSLKQIEILSSHKNHYHLFLLTTMARTPILPRELELWFKKNEAAAAVENLIGAGLILSDEAGISPTAVEAKFPEAYNEKLKQAYAKFDNWDEQFGEQFGLEFLFNKMLIRRISSRYLPVIKKQLEVLADLVRASDEIDKKYNDRVVQVKIMLRHGNLPG